MKEIIILFLAVTFMGNVNAQKKLIWNFQSGINYSVANLYYHNQKIYTSTEGPAYLYGLMLGINGEYKIGKNIKLTSGLLLGIHTWRVDLYSNTRYIIPRNAVVLITELPVGIYFKVKENTKVEFFVGGGLMRALVERDTYYLGFRDGIDINLLAKLGTRYNITERLSTQFIFSWMPDLIKNNTLGGTGTFYPYKLNYFNLSINYKILAK